MENSNESKIFLDQDLKESLERAQKHTLETKAHIEGVMKVLQEALNNLQNTIDYITHMKESNEFVHIYKDTTGKDSHSNEYPPEFIAKVEKDKEVFEQVVTEAKALVAELVLEDASANAYKEGLEKINQEFKDNLLKLESFNLN